jgi:hypothetical protein
MSPFSPPAAQPPMKLSAADEKGKTEAKPKNCKSLILYEKTA